MQRVLILQHVWENPQGFVGQLLDEHHIAYDIVNVEEEALPDPTKYAAVIALGGSQHVYDEESYPYFTQEKALIKQIVEHDIPFLGICLSCQLLAAVLGGQVKQHIMTEIGFFDVQLTEEGKHDPLFAGLPGYQKVFHWHEDTFDLPQGAVLLATSENTENQAFRYGKRAYGLQYHIELDTHMLDDWLYHPLLKDSVFSTLGEQNYQELEQERLIQMPSYQEHTRMIFINFLRMSDLAPQKIE